jgi:hypothetical protein
VSAGGGEPPEDLNAAAWSRSQSSHERAGTAGDALDRVEHLGRVAGRVHVPGELHQTLGRPFRHAGVQQPLPELVLADRDEPDVPSDRRGDLGGELVAAGRLGPGHRERLALMTALQRQRRDRGDVARVDRRDPRLGRHRAVERAVVSDAAR